MTSHLPEQRNKVGVIGTPRAHNDHLESGQIVMIAGEQFPGFITGFRDDGTIGVQLDRAHISVRREQITWRQTWRGYGQEKFRV